MLHEESKIQQQCVSLFRAKYPQFAMLLVHPINEGSQYTRVTGAIHKAEGAVAGVADLLLFLPAVFSDETVKLTGVPKFACGLAIEMKTEKGKQSQEQKDFARIIRAACWDYEVIRSVEQFEKLTDAWIKNVQQPIKDAISLEHKTIEKERAEKELAHFKKVLERK